MLAQIIIVNMGLAIFNLIPIPPFDGFKIAQELKLFSREMGHKIERSILLQLIAIFVAIQIFQIIFPRISD
ncbi:MAG: site-2 protease family protein [Cyanobium sp. MAG06]|nr:site-2 protease family protein [Cyanobium sp. MAG06]